MKVDSDISLHDRSPVSGFITWFDIIVLEMDDFDEGGETIERIGEASIALVHVAEANEAGAHIHAVLDADSSELEALYNVYFDGQWFKDNFSEGFGNDLLYIADIRIDGCYEGCNVDIAVIARALNTIGQGYMLAVIPYESSAERNYWARMGFEVSTTGDSKGLMHLHHACPRPRIVGPDEKGRFTIVPVPSQGKRVGDR